MLTQVENETRQRKLGEARARRQIETAARSSYIGDTKVGRRLVSEAAAPIAESLRHLYETEQAKTRRGRTVTWALEVLDELGFDTVAVTALRVGLNLTWAEPADARKISDRIGYELSEEAFFRRLKNEERTKFNRAVRRAKRGRNRVTRRGKAFKSLREDDIDYEVWPRDKRISIGLLFLEAVRQQADIFECRTVLEKRTKRRGPRQTVVVTLTEQAREWFDHAAARQERMSPVYLPMVEPPKSWDTVYEGGMHSDESRRRPFTRPKAGVGLGIYEEGIGDVLDAANALQGTAWKINEDALEAVQYVFDNDPQRLGLEDDRLIRKAATDLQIAGDYKGRHLWYSHFADFRGRLYPLCSNLQYQSWSMARGLLTFGNPEPIDTPEAERWFRIHGANLWGEDKVSFDDRVEWTHNQREMIEAIGNDPLGCTAWLDADEPVSFLTWAMEMTEFLGQGLGYKSFVPVGMDGSNNGLQLLSLLLRDPEGARWTNCVPLDQPEDIYGRVSQRLLERLLDYRSEDIVNPKEPTEIQMTGTQAAKAWLEFFQYEAPPRYFPKRGTMTRPYSVSHYSFHNYVREAYEQMCKETGRKVVPHDPYPCTALLANEMWRAVDDVVVAARDGMDWMKECAKTLVQHSVCPQWVSPSGFPVRQDYRKKDKERVNFVFRGDSVKVSRNYATRLESSNPESLEGRGHMNGISPNYIHSLDAALMHLTIKGTKDRIKSYRMIHDDYGCHAKHAPYLAQKLRETAVEMFQRDLLGDLRNQLQTLLPAGVELPETPEYGELDIEELVNAEYFFS
jgi:DNA-directed RNA polymerase